MDIDQIIKALEILKLAGLSVPLNCNLEAGRNLSNLNDIGDAIAQDKEGNPTTELSSDASQSNEAGFIAALNASHHGKDNNEHGKEFNEQQLGIRVMTKEGNMATEGQEQTTKTFAQALQGSPVMSPLAVSRPPRIGGGNVIVEIDENDYEHQCRECQYDVIGRNILQKGDNPYSTKELKLKLASICKIQNFEITHMSKGFYHVFLRNMDYQSLVLSMGSLNLKPGIFKLSRCITDFNPINQKQTNAQCWLIVYDLPMEYRGATNLWNIARSAGMPLKIDPISLNKTGPYSRILVDVDCSLDLPERVLIQRKSDGFEFFASLFYEFFSHYCQHCGTIGHKQEKWRRMEAFRNVENTNNGRTRNVNVAENGQAAAATVQPGLTRNGARECLQQPCNAENAIEEPAIAQTQQLATEHPATVEGPATTQIIEGDSSKIQNHNGVGGMVASGSRNWHDMVTEEENAVNSDNNRAKETVETANESAMQGSASPNRLSQPQWNSYTALRRNMQTPVNPKGPKSSWCQRSNVVVDDRPPAHSLRSKGSINGN